jgi:hypothetical protein
MASFNAVAGARWGAISERHRAPCGLAERSTYALQLPRSHRGSHRQQTPIGIDFRRKTGRVRGEDHQGS